MQFKLTFQAKGYSLQLTSQKYVQTSITVSWTAPEGHEQNDIIQLYELLPPSTLTKITFKYVQQAGYDSGSVDFKVDHPGTFICNYLLASSSNLISVASSDYFNVTGILLL